MFSPISCLFSQKSGNPFITNYSFKDYKASVSNFSAVSDNRGIMYFGNINGILEYDGSSWRLIDVANGKSAFVLANNSNNETYVGSINEFGYIRASEIGQEKYVSISDLLEFNQFGQIVNIEFDDNDVYFISRHQVFKYSEGHIKRFDLGKDYIDVGSFVHNDELYLPLKGKGLYKLSSEGELQLANHGEILKDDRILSSFTYNPSTKILLSGFGHSYLLINDLHEHSLFDERSIEKISPHIVYSGSTYIHQSDTILAIGTRRNGVYVLINNTIIEILNESNSKLGNETRQVLFDNQGNLWSTSINGIHLQSGLGQWSLWESTKDIDGIIFDIIRYNNSIYISTTEGVYILQNNSFHKLESFDGSSHTFFKIDKALFVNLSNGISKIKGSDLENKLKINSPFRIQKINDSTGIVHTLNSGLLWVEFDSIFDKIEHSQIISSITNGVSKSGIVYKNDYWFNIKDSGIYKYSISDSSVQIFSNKHGLPTLAKLDLFKYENKLLIATSSGFYKINPNHSSDSSDLFIPDNSLLKDRIAISHPVIDSRGNIWYIAVYDNFSSRVEKLELQKDGSFITQVHPFKRIPDQELIKIYPDPDEKGIIWIAGTEGLYRFNDNFEKDYETPFNTLIRKVITVDSLIFGGAYYDQSDTTQVPPILHDQPYSFRPSLSYNRNQLTFEYAATSYEVPEKNEFSYWLKGNDEGWSGWSKETKKEYTNLSAGTYTFHVKSKNVYDTEGKIATYEFTILPPWHQTSWAYLLWAILGGFSVWVIALVYNYRIRLQRRKLKLIVADRTFEVLSQKKEIEKQHNQLLEKTEEIKQQSDVLSEKNVELESQQEEILTINHQLNELNNHLEIEVDNRTKKIKTTLTKLRKTNKELDTFIYRASHDLKSPISRIKGLTSLAKLEIPDDVNRQYFELIEQASNDMKLLLDKLTQLHEVVNKKVIRAAIDLPSLLSTVRESLKHLDKGKNTKYSFNIKDQLELLSDEDIIQVIIENLVENALIFRKSPDEEHHIKIEVIKRDDSILIKVWDNGIGIESEHHVQLFDMFFRASDKSKGSGLGLYLVKMAAEKLEGTVKVNSEPNKYTEFTVSFPF